MQPHGAVTALEHATAVVKGEVADASGHGSHHVVGTAGVEVDGWLHGCGVDWDQLASVEAHRLRCRRSCEALGLLVKHTGFIRRLKCPGRVMREYGIRLDLLVWILPVSKRVSQDD